MYESIVGILKDKRLSQAIVQTGGISYRLTIPFSTYAKLPSIGSSLDLFLSHVVREDAHTLYAFLEKEERDLFEVLIGLSGIGPKTAIAIIGRIDVVSFQKAISTADLKLLGTIPGIGKKTAERLVIEMKDKLKTKEAVFPLSENESQASDAIQALMHLGYPASNAQRAVQKAIEHEKEEMDLGCLIATALRNV